MKQIITGGITSYRAVIFVQNATSTVGAGLTGLTHASSGLSWYWYSDAGGTSSSVTITGQTLGTWTSGGFVEIDSTNLPGFYEIGVPNAVVAAAQSFAVMELFGAANMVPVNVEYMIALVSFRNSTTFGLSALPFATAGSSGGLLLYGTGSGEINPANGTVTATVPSLSTNVNIQEWLGTAVTSNAGVPVVFTTNTVTSVVASGTVTTVSGNVVGSVASVVGTVTATVPSEVSANVTEWLGTAVTSHSGIPQVYTDGGTIGVVTGTVTATVPSAGGTNVNVVEWNGTAVATPNIGGIPVVDVVDWLGTAVTSNTGVPLVDVNDITGTVTAVVVGGTIATVTNPVTLATNQLTVRRNEALAGFTFPMYDATTGNPTTGLSVSCSISIDGAALTGSTNSPSEVGGGIYKLNLAAADLDGTVITLVFVASSASATIVTLITQA